MNVPNALSILRILMIPFFAVLYLTAKTPQDYWFAAGLLLLSGLTDVLDGIIARKYHLVTKLGRILDPVADKLTQAAVCVLLAIRNPDLSILPIMYIIKEGLMLIGGYKILKKSKDIASSPLVWKDGHSSVLRNHDASYRVPQSSYLVYFLGHYGSDCMYDFFFYYVSSVIF